MDMLERRGTTVQYTSQCWRGGGLQCSIPLNVGEEGDYSAVYLSMLERRGTTVQHTSQCWRGGGLQCSIPLNDVSGGSQQEVSLTVSHLKGRNKQVEECDGFSSNVPSVPSLQCAVGTP